MTFSGIHQFVLDGWIVLFLVDNFRVHRFLHKKSSRKSWFWNSCSVRHIWWVMGLKKNSPWIPVRIEVFCFYTFFEIFKFLAFQKILLNTPHLGWCSAVHFWRNSTRFAGFLAVIFTSQWLLASRNHWGLRNAKKNLQKFINSEKILEISEKFSIIFVVFRISNRSTLKRQSIFNFF